MDKLLRKDQSKRCVKKREFLRAFLPSAFREPHFKNLGDKKSLKCFLKITILKLFASNWKFHFRYECKKRFSFGFFWIIFSMWRHSADSESSWPKTPTMKALIFNFGPSTSLFFYHKDRKETMFNNTCTTIDAVSAICTLDW